MRQLAALADFLLAAVLLAACSKPPEPPQVVRGRRADRRVPAGSGLAELQPRSRRHAVLAAAASLPRRTSTSCGKRGPIRSAPSAAAEGSELTPLVVDGVLYATAADRVVALRADTGAEIWRFALTQGVPSQRGLAYWSGDAAAAVPARIFFTVGRTLVALDAATGQKTPAFGAGGEVTMPSPYAGAPTLFEDYIIVGSNGPPGGVRAYDVRSGEERWRFVGASTLLHPASSLTVDVDRALVYAVFAGPEPDVFYGGARGATEDPYLNSVVAIEARTGNAQWHFQTVHHDVWDYDLSAPPALLDAAVRGARRPILALATPAGYLYLLDRVTGEPVFGVVETAAPASDVPGEHSGGDAAGAAETAADRARGLRR